MKNTLLISIAILFQAQIFSQDCSKYMKKEKKGVITTKDQALANEMMEKHLIAFVKQDGKIYIEYYKSNINSNHGPLADAMSETMMVDTVRLDLFFTTREELTLKFAAEDSKMSGISLRGTALRHYYLELTEEQMELLSTKRLKQYRIFHYSGDKKEKQDSRKMKSMKPNHASDILNAAKCFVKEIQ